MRSGSSGSPSDRAGLRALHCATCGQVDHLANAQRRATPPRYGSKASGRTHVRVSLTKRTNAGTPADPRPSYEARSLLPLTPPVQMGTPSATTPLEGHAHLNAQSQIVPTHTVH